MDRPVDYEQTNVLATVRLLEFCRQRSVPRFVFASSSSVYGPGAALPTPEYYPCDPCSPYALTKLHGEQWGQLYAKIHGLQFLALRFFTVCGDGQRPDLALEKFQRQMQRGESVTIHGDGTNRRDLVHAHDIARAVGLALDCHAPGFSAITLGTGRNHSVLEMVEAAASFTGFTPQVTHGPAHPADVPETLAAIENARVTLGWQPSIRFPDRPASEAKKV